MRQVGQFKQEKLALRFWEYLKHQEIDSSLEEDDTLGTWTIWVADEDKIELAIQKEKQFSENPDDPTFFEFWPQKNNLESFKPSKDEV